MDFVPFLALGLLLKKIIDWIRVVIPDHIEAKVLIPFSMVLGAGLALLFSASDALGNAITIFTDKSGFEYTLGNADIYMVIVFGLFVGAAGGVIHDITKPSTPPHDQPEVMAEKRAHEAAEGNVIVPAGEPLDQVTIVAEDQPPA